MRLNTGAALFFFAVAGKTAALLIGTIPPGADLLAPDRVDSLVPGRSPVSHVFLPAARLLGPRGEPQLVGGNRRAPAAYTTGA
jgi:hypothetical protein